MTSTSTAISTSGNGLPVHDPQQPPASTSKSCWSEWGWRDCIIVPVEAGTGIASAICLGFGATNSAATVFTNAIPAGGNSTAGSTSGVSPNSYIFYAGAALLAVVTVAEVGIHYLWRRDAKNANLHKAAQELDKTVQAVTKAEQDQEIALKKLEVQDTLLVQNAEKLETLHTTFAQERNTLNQQVATLAQTTQSINQQNTTLVNENRLLQQQVQRLQQVLNEVKECLSEFTEENKELKVNAESLKNVVADFGKQQKAFEFTESKIDETLGVNITKLAEQVKSSQTSSQEVLEAFATRIHELQSTIDQLKDTEKKIGLDQDTLTEKEKQLGLLQKDLQQVENALQDRQTEYAKISQALASTQSELASTLQKLQDAEKKMSSDTGDLQHIIQPLSDLAQNLDTLSNKIAQDVDSLNVLSEKNKQQKNAIANL